MREEHTCRTAICITGLASSLSLSNLSDIEFNIPVCNLWKGTCSKRTTRVFATAVATVGDPYWNAFVTAITSFPRLSANS